MYDEMISLNPVERNLKKLWKENPERHLEESHDKAEVEDILNEAFAHVVPEAIQDNVRGLVSEGNFIEEEMDCAFVRHLRYLPTFWHRHEFFEMLMVESGSCKNILPGQSFVMKSGDICIHAPGTVHAVSAFQDEDRLINILIRKSTFEQSFLGLMENDTILSTFFRRVFYEPEEIPYLLIHTGNDEELKHIEQKAFEEYRTRLRYRRQMTDTWLSAFFITLFRRHEQHIEVPNIRMKSEDDSIMYILHYMQSNYNTVTLHSLASFFHYSDRQIQRIIREATGMSFTENIQQQKMKKASEYLKNPEYSITEICEKTGFDSPNHFRKIFERYFHSTPSEYRKIFEKDKI